MITCGGKHRSSLVNGWEVFICSICGARFDAPESSFHVYTCKVHPRRQDVGYGRCVECHGGGSGEVAFG